MFNDFHITDEEGRKGRKKTQNIVCIIYFKS